MEAAAIGFLDGAAAEPTPTAASGCRSTRVQPTTLILSRCDNTAQLKRHEHSFKKYATPAIRVYTYMALSLLNQLFSLLFHVGP